MEKKDKGNCLSHLWGFIETVIGRITACCLINIILILKYFKTLNIFIHPNLI